MEFTVRACSGHARVGSLRLASGLEFETPSLLMITRRGLPAVFPPEMLMDLHPDSRACQFTPMHFLEDPLAAIVAKAGGIHKLASLTGFAMVAVARDSLGNELAGEEASNLGASFETSSGRRIVGFEKYMEVVNACKPDLWVSLPDEVPYWVSEKRNRDSVDHTSLWLDHCLSLQHAEHGNRCLGVVVGAASLEERARSAGQAATRNVAVWQKSIFNLLPTGLTKPHWLLAANATLAKDILKFTSTNYSIRMRRWLKLFWRYITRTTIWSFLRLFENPSRLISSMSSGSGLPVKGRNSGFFLWGIFQGS